MCKTSSFYTTESWTFSITSNKIYSSSYEIIPHNMEKNEYTLKYTVKKFY